jgi:hypothetical protein
MATLEATAGRGTDASLAVASRKKCADARITFPLAIRADTSIFFFLFPFLFDSFLSFLLSSVASVHGFLAPRSGYESTWRCHLVASLSACIPAMLPVYPHLVRYSGKNFSGLSASPILFYLDPRYPPEMIRTLATGNEVYRHDGSIRYSPELGTRTDLKVENWGLARRSRSSDSG